MGRSALEGERRQVTVLFGDIAGFTTMSEKLDPEDVREIVERAFGLVTVEIHRFEGTINHYSGDGLMALFGAPIAHEDAPRRAVHAALGIQRALREYGAELQQERGLRLQMRIGLNTGTVVVGKIADDLHMEYTAIGDTINLASRLQTAARPGGVVISEATYKAVSGYFEALDLGELTVKGHAPARAFEVLREHGRRGRGEAAAERGLTPLVGRERELAALEDLFRQVKGRHGQVAFVAGEAGIGKSRLLVEFRRRLADAGEDVTWLEGRCVSFGQSMPMLPTIDQLRENFRIEEADGEPEIIAKVEHGMRRLGGLAAEIPFVRYLLSVDPGDPAITEMDSAERRNRLFKALRTLALRGAALRPMVLVFEDLHWVDTSTQEYLDLFMDSIAGAAVMLVLTYRVGHQPPFGSRSYHTSLNLRHLTDAQALEMATRVLGAEEFPEELKTALTEKAEGVPLFVEEVTKTLLDLGFLRRENGRYRMAKALGEMTIPETIQGIIMARLDRLGEDGKRAVQLASVIGRQFMARLLERIAGLTGKLEGVLGELKALEIIYEEGMLPEPAYIFKHAVIQDVAYNSLLLQKRKELHRAVGQAIEELYRDRLTEHHAELAHHFTLGEHWSKAMEYGTLAGEQAAHSYANTEAEQHYAGALQAASKLPLADRAAVADLHGKHAEILSVTGRHDEAIAEYEEALQIARAVKDRGCECRILLGLCQAYFNAHLIELLIERNHEAFAIAREMGDQTLQALCAATTIFPTSCYRGATDEITAEAEEAVRLSGETADPRIIATAEAGLGGVLQWRGEFDRSLPHLLRGVELARSAHSGNCFGTGVFWLALTHFSRGEYEDTLKLLRQLSEYADGAGDRFFLSRIPNLFGGVHLELYDLEEALRLNLEGEEAGRKLSPWPEPRGHSLLKAGLAHFEGGEQGRAEEFFLRAWALLEGDDFTRWRWHVPLLHARGQLALVREQRDEAWKFATESLDLANKTCARKHVARAWRLQAEVQAAGGRLDEAVRMLDGSARLAEELKTPREIWMARSALGNVLVKLGRDKDAEAQYERAAGAIESIAGKLHTPALSRSFLNARPVRELYKTLGRRPPDPVSSSGAA
jgi:class 3 adenylate cyclase/tetratricopeptide (TPR) repeat protein